MGHAATRHLPVHARESPQAHSVHGGSRRRDRHSRRGLRDL